MTPRPAGALLALLLVGCSDPDGRAHVYGNLGDRPFEAVSAVAYGAFPENQVFIQLSTLRVACSSSGAYRPRGARLIEGWLEDATGEGLYSVSHAEGARGAALRFAEVNTDCELAAGATARRGVIDVTRLSRSTAGEVIASFELELDSGDIIGGTLVAAVCSVSGPLVELEGTGALACH